MKEHTGTYSREKFLELSNFLEKELETFKAVYEKSLEKIKIIQMDTIQDFVVDFQRINEEKIAELEEQINYLKELNLSQRLMMEDYLKYVKHLESRIADIT
jgi:hypothetical protein